MYNRFLGVLTSERGWSLLTILNTRGLAVATATRPPLLIKYGLNGVTDASSQRFRL